MWKGKNRNLFRHFIEISHLVTYMMLDRNKMSKFLLDRVFMHEICTFWLFTFRNWKWKGKKNICINDTFCCLTQYCKIPSISMHNIQKIEYSFALSQSKLHWFQCLFCVWIGIEWACLHPELIVSFFHSIVCHCCITKTYCRKCAVLMYV